MDVIIYHNPACGTSRNVLAMIRNSGVEPHIIEYLKCPPTRLLLTIGFPTTACDAQRRMASGAFQPAASTCRTTTSLGRPTCRRGSCGADGAWRRTRRSAGHGLCRLRSRRIAAFDHGDIEDTGPAAGEAGNVGDGFLFGGEGRGRAAPFAGRIGLDLGVAHLRFPLVG
jgi:hypothetical protein